MNEPVSSFIVELLSVHDVRSGQVFLNTLEFIAIGIKKFGHNNVFAVNIILAANLAGHQKRLLTGWQREQSMEYVLWFMVGQTFR